MVNAETLPLDILSAVAGGRDDLKAMREVCKTWKAGFERSVSGIKIFLSSTNRCLPAGCFLNQRFPMLTSLDLGESALKERELLWLGLPHLLGLTHLTLGCDRGLLAHAGLVGDDRPLARQLTGEDFIPGCLPGALLESWRRPFDDASKGWL